METEKQSYKYETLSQAVIVKCISDFRRSFSYLGDIMIKIPIEDEISMRYLREEYEEYDNPHTYFSLDDVEDKMMIISKVRKT